MRTLSLVGLMVLLLCPSALRAQFVYGTTGLPLVTEAFPFDERTLVFRILGKIFACVDLERPEWVTMKCNLKL